MLIAISEISPYVRANYIQDWFPFLVTAAGRGVVMLLLSLFCFSKHMGVLGIVAGGALLLTGSFSIAYHYKAASATNIYAEQSDESAF